MKRKSLGLLSLNKTTISSLSQQAAHGIKGGRLTEDTCSECGGSCCGATKCNDSCGAIKMEL